MAHAPCPLSSTVPVPVLPYMFLHVIAPSFSSSVKNCIAEKANSNRRHNMFPALLTQPPRTQKGAHEHLAASSEIQSHSILPGPHARGVCEAMSHQHITDGDRALRALCLPEWFMGPVNPADWTAETAGACSTEQQSITTGWESPRNLSRASSWWHLCRGRKRNKGKRRQSEPRVENPPGFSQNFRATEEKQDYRHRKYFGVCSDSGGPALEPQMTTFHTAGQGALVPAIWAAIRDCFPIC